MDSLHGPDPPQAIKRKVSVVHIWQKKYEVQGIDHLRNILPSFRIFSYTLPCNFRKFHGSYPGIILPKLKVDDGCKLGVFAEVRFSPFEEIFVIFAKFLSLAMFSCE